MSQIFHLFICAISHFLQHNHHNNIFVKSENYVTVITQFFWFSCYVPTKVSGYPACGGAEVFT